MSLSLSLAALCLSPALALSKPGTTSLFATHYTTSKVHTLQLSHANTTNNNYSLTETSALETCGTYPSWITLDPASRTLYCSDEDGYRNANQAVNGSLTALEVGHDGLLSEIASTSKAPGSGVHNVVYEAGGEKYLAVAH